ncbi:MAG: DUF2493 domain-containing protein [Endomicrobium sp.]|jgi:hypothetical protein|nr:DUF2493 domain-containing protein [Endomicrobium sp.]
MKIIIAGSRTFNDYKFLSEKLCQLNRDDIIISGMAKGADILAYRYAKEHKMQVIEMPADWNKYQKSAGVIRNKEMAKIADELIAFWDAKSRGAKHMIDIMKKMNKKVTVYLIGQ